MQTITVTVIIGAKRREVGRYADLPTAEAVGTAWTKWSGCKAALLTNGSAPPLVLIRPDAAASVVPVPR